MSSDAQFTAHGPTIIGFQTNGANIQTGADIAGNNDGVVARCGAGSGELGAGVHAISTANNGNAIIADANVGSNAFGIWARASRGLAGRFDGRTRVNGDFHVQGRFTVSGEKAAVVSFSDGSQHCLYAVESPESWFEDFGFGELVDGRATIQLDGDFVSVVSDEPYHVFITEYDENNSLYVTAQTASAFEVRAKTPGAGNRFSYRVVAKRKDVAGRRFDEVRQQATTKSLDGNPRG